MAKRSTLGIAVLSAIVSSAATWAIVALTSGSSAAERHARTVGPYDAISQCESLLSRERIKVSTWHPPKTPEDFELYAKHTGGDRWKVSGYVGFTGDMIIYNGKDAQEAWAADATCEISYASDSGTWNQDSPVWIGNLRDVTGYK